MIILQPDLQFGQPPTPTASSEQRQSSVYYSGLTQSISSTVLNLSSLIAGKTPVSGALAPLFDTTKLLPQNANGFILFKLVMTGTWTGLLERSLVVNLTNTNTNFRATRSSSITSDTINFSTFFTLTKDDVLALQGAAITFQCPAGGFTPATLLLSAEQVIFN